jgi:hypothetical protein
MGRPLLILLSYCTFVWPAPYVYASINGSSLNERQKPDPQQQRLLTDRDFPSLRRSSHPPPLPRHLARVSHEPLRVTVELTSPPAW